MPVKYSMGIMNYCSHDSACALMRVDNNKIDLIFAEEGFLSRKKTNYQFPLRSMKYCLDHFGIKIDDIDVLMLDYMDEKRTFRTSNNYRLLIGDYIRSRLKIDKQEIKFVKSHHYAHALTAFWPSMLSESAVLVVDGLGSQQQTHSVFYMNDKGLVDRVFEQKGTGIGELYSLVTKILGFGAGEEGKTMGLAPYGKDLSPSDLQLPSLSGRYSGFTVDYSEIVDRHPSPKFKVNLRKPKNKKEVYQPYFSRLAYELQSETEKCLTHLAKEALNVTASKNLCFAGGVAFNCVANNHIQNLKQIENFWVQPASGDSGIPFGLALAGLEEIGFDLAELMTSDNRKKLSIPYSRDRKPLATDIEHKLETLLRNYEIKLRPFESTEIAQRISEKKIVGLYSQGIELGPRALGHRSFLGDARLPEMKDILNSKIKHREGYRPFAPIVLKQDFSSYFISPTNNHPYMLQAPICKERAIHEVPAICHVDHTARVQTITADNGKVFEILSAYKRITGTAVIINTSFNDNDEPIVFTKLDALNSFLRCNADTLVLEDAYINREDIADIDSLKIDAEKLQQLIMDEYYMMALEELTSINQVSSQLQNSQLRDFISFNARLSKTFSTDRLHLKLVDYLLKRDPRRLLVLDEYHYELISVFADLIGKNINSMLEYHLLINDHLGDIGSIPEDSDFMLYNLSAYYHNAFTRGNFNNSETLYSFYELNDKKIQKEMFFKVCNQSPVGINEQIMQSYEHSKKTSIDDFFSQLVGEM